MRAIVISLFAFLAVSCGESVPDVSPGNVTLINESSYSVSVYHGSFSGALLVDTLPSGSSYSTIVSTSDNYGIGSVFSIRYWFCAGGKAWTTGIDPNEQIQRNIEAGKSYEIQIPNSSNIGWEDSFIKIQNASDDSFHFNYLNQFYRQAGTGEFPVPAGETGIYKINPSDNHGLEIVGYTITQVFKPTFPFPDFTAEKGHIYNYIFDGDSVEKARKWEEKI
jgi:hypothetical protein